MSEAAKPADPERALARLELLMAQREALLPGYERRTGIENEQLHGLTHRVQQELLEAAEGWLLPLARAGLRAQSPVAADETLARMWFGDPCDATCSLNEPWGSDGPPCECQQKLIADFAAVRGAGDALRAEFAACVRALASIRETARRDYTLALMPDVVADAQRALSGPLGAAPSPEPRHPRGWRCVMGDGSRISWTDASWNPVTGCSHVSRGCEHCYAEALSLRFGRSKKPWTAQNAAENVVLHPDRLDMPTRWTRPRMVFVNSMSDLFHELVPDEFALEVWKRMNAARQHTFQVLIPSARIGCSISCSACSRRGRTRRSRTCGSEPPSRRTAGARAPTCCARHPRPCASSPASRCLGRSRRSTSPASIGSSSAASREPGTGPWKSSGRAGSWREHGGIGERICRRAVRRTPPPHGSCARAGPQRGGRGLRIHSVAVRGDRQLALVAQRRSVRKRAASRSARWGQRDPGATMSRARPRSMIGGDSLSWNERRPFVARLRAAPIIAEGWPHQCRCGDMVWVKYRGRIYCRGCGRRHERCPRKVSGTGFCACPLPGAEGGERLNAQ